MKDLVISFVLVFWFFFQKDRFDKVEWFVEHGYPVVDAFIQVYNGNF